MAAGRSCCICHRFCGTKIECHHIKHESEGGENTLENCIPVCFDCHADMTSYDFKHPKGTKYTERELRAHKDGWFGKVASGARKAIDTARVSRDRRVYESFIARIAYDPTVVYFKHHGFAAAFPLSIMEPLHHYEYDKDDPANQFADSYIESLRASFLASIDAFASVLSMNTWTLPHQPGFSQVPREWEENNYARLMDVEARLTKTYTVMHEAYAALTLECQIRLYAP